MKSQGLEPAGAPWEVYVTDPGAEPDPSKWRTDIFFPVR
jgi:AraC family transcriptional regulator